MKSRCAIEMSETSIDTWLVLLTSSHPEFPAAAWMKMNSVRETTSAIMMQGAKGGFVIYEVARRSSDGND